MLNIYNTLTKSIDPIQPSKDQLSMYTCGPTVYEDPHIGNMRSNIGADLLYRTLKHNGQTVKWVMNLTDIDDKTIKGTVAEFGQSATVDNLRIYTQKFTDKFYSDLDKVNVSVNEIEFIKVTDVIPQIQQFIIELIDKGYAYTAEDGTTYFSIEKYQADFKDYGQLVGDKFIEGKKIGARVKVDEYDKDNLSDFALWKAWDETSDAQIFWDHPVLGKGRPGWHIECSVINNVAFGNNPTDIHTGGVDLIFPHHTNEIAQSQPFYQPFTKTWVHGEFLLVDNTKMSKSLGNYHTVTDIETKGFSGLDLRYLFLQTHFKKQTNFTWEALEAARTAREKLHKTVQRGALSNLSKDPSASSHDDKQAGVYTEEVYPSSLSVADHQDGKNLNTDPNSSAIPNVSEGSLQKFHDALNDNLNTAEALALAWKNKNHLLEYDKVLGLGLDQKLTDQIVSIPKEVQDLVRERQIARDNKDFAAADQLRDQIAQLGFTVKDSPEGQQVSSK